MKPRATNGIILPSPAVEIYTRAPHLAFINLSINRIGDDGVAALASMAAQRRAVPKLAKLLLKNCDLGVQRTRAVGEVAIRRAVGAVYTSLGRYTPPKSVYTA